MPSGMVVLSEMVPGVRSVSAGVWIPWGASHDPVERMGAAHLLEHMIFKGTERREARDIALEIESLGGSLDAYTSREHTACFIHLLDDHLPIGIDVLADLIFHPLLRERDLDTERSVILEEIAGVEDTPDELVFDLHARALWGRHPYGNPVLGTHETVSAITAEELRRQWAASYRPGLCVVAAAGNLSHETLVDLVARNFPSDGGSGAGPSVSEPEPVAPEERRVGRETAQVHICVGAPTFPRRDPRRYGAILINKALGGGMSSRLFQRVREELGLAYAVYSFQSFYLKAGLAGVYMATRADTADRAVDEVRAELDGLAVSGLPPAELAAVQEQTKGQIVLALESTTARLHRLAAFALYGEPYLSIDEVCARIEAVDEAEVAELCQRYFAAGCQAVVRLGPDETRSADEPAVRMRPSS